jgi:hypothetical protein
MPVAEDAIRARQGIRPAAFAHNALERLIDVLYAVFELAVLDRQFLVTMCGPPGTFGKGRDLDQRFG